MKNHLEHLRTEPFTTHREWTEAGIPVLCASVSLPEPAPALNAVCRRIRRYYRLQGRAFLRYCQKTLLPLAQAEARAALAESRPLPEFRAELTYQVTYNANGFWSLYTQVREHTLPGQDLLIRRGDTWDLNDGYPAALSDFFPRRSGWKRQLLSAAEAEALRRERAGVSRYRESLRRDLRRRFSARNYYLTEEGLSLFYPMYAIAPAPEGIPVFTLPYGEGSLLRPEVLSQAQSPAPADTMKNAAVP